MIDGWCPHGERPCRGDPEHGLPACADAEHRYCPHGVRRSLTTTEHEPRCPYCRGVKRPDRNRDTYQPRRTRNLTLPTGD